MTWTKDVTSLAVATRSSKIQTDRSRRTGDMTGKDDLEGMSNVDDQKFVIKVVTPIGRVCSRHFEKFG